MGLPASEIAERLSVDSRTVDAILWMMTELNKYIETRKAAGSTDAELDELGRRFGSYCDDLADDD